MQGLPPENRRQSGDTHHLHHLGDGGVHSVVAQQLRAGLWHVQTSSGAELWLDDLSLLPAKQGGAGGVSAELRAPFNGKVIRVDAPVGATLAAGSVVVVIESMKLEHALSVPAEVVVAEALVEAGQQVSPGQLLLRFAPPVAKAADAAKDQAPA